MKMSVALLPFMLYCCVFMEVLVIGKPSNLIVSPNCTEDPPPAWGMADCSTITTGSCTLQRYAAADPEEIEGQYPADNTRSRYTTCLAQDPQFANLMRCEVSKVRFEDKNLKTEKGPKESNVTYNYFKLFSRNFNNDNAYPKNELALYSVFCNQLQVDSILTVSMLKHSLESTKPCPNQAQCVDFLKMELPYGDTCTTCGDFPIKCSESVQYELPSQLHFDGIHKLHSKFRTNRQKNTLWQGFQFLTSCVEKSYFFSDNCTTPSALPGRKRRSGERHVVVPRRFVLKAATFMESLEPIIVVKQIHATASVSYSNFAVKVSGSSINFKHTNIGVFRVFNFAEGLRSYTGVALTSQHSIRTFPGYGVLYIHPPDNVRRIRTAYFHQTGIPPMFLPTPAETEIILRLRRHIMTLIKDGFDHDDDHPIPNVSAVTSLPSERSHRSIETDQDALDYGNACNGILRADACIYQQLVFGNVTDDCLQGLIS